MILGEALEQRPPVADRRVERRLVRIVAELHAIPAPRVREPGLPERPVSPSTASRSIATAPVTWQPGGQRARGTKTPSSTPTASTSTSTAAPCASRDERLVHFVGHRVGDADGDRRQLRPSARTSSAPSTAYSAAWAIFRRARSQPPRPVPRSGIEDSAKMRAAQATTGSQAESTRASRRNGRLGPDIGGRVREPGASPGRSRRCEGRRCPATMPLADAGKAAEQGAPSQKTCRPSNPNPSWKEDSCDGLYLSSHLRRCC